MVKLMENTQQEEIWSGKFGKEYTDRNLMTPDEADQLWVDNCGISRREVNKEFFNSLKVNRILEVGCNVGNQLLLLQDAEYVDLWGIELQDYAVKIARKRTSDINIIKGSAFDIPYKDNFFDLVFTSGVLIHISPNNIEKALDEIYRCTKRYILGFEYYYPDGYQMVNYRRGDDLLWKTDFANLFLDRFPDLKLIKDEKYPYLKDKKLVDQVFLLKKIEIDRRFL
ncbi:Ubiquinone/menaquinone biosynthesis C-methylase UbiE [Candidatus Methanomarinus sp.]|nr:Ubiquinone/menaquinone biosynthesis C-methylase UbiE [ANME-2 cluster archaeon]